MVLPRLELIPHLLMRREDSVFLIESRRNGLTTFRMTKTRAAMFLVMIIVGCAVLFSITDAYPAQEPETASGDMKLSNNSRLVITHVVKTIEFEVGIVDGDDLMDDNSTDSDASEFYETDIQLLNVDLLKEVVNQADEEEKSPQQTPQPEIQSTEKPKQVPVDSEEQIPKS